MPLIYCTDAIRWHRLMKKRGQDRRRNKIPHHTDRCLLALNLLQTMRRHCLKESECVTLSENKHHTSKYQTSKYITRYADLRDLSGLVLVRDSSSPPRALPAPSAAEPRALHDPLVHHVPLRFAVVRPAPTTREKKRLYGIARYSKALKGHRVSR